MSATDLGDALCAFEVRNICRRFALEHSYTAAEVGITSTRGDAGSEVPLLPSDCLWPGLGTVAMRFS